MMMLAILLLGCRAASASNILPDADLAGIDPAANVEDGWRWDPVVTPNEVVVDGGSVTIRGRKGFLRSPDFRTRLDPTLSYRIDAEVHGKGGLRIEAVWWNADRFPAAPHIEFVTEFELTGTPKQIEAVAHPGGGAAIGQIRFIQTSASDDGLLVLRKPSVTVVPRRFEPGELLLALDAARPGPAPAQLWKDLSGRNRPFQVMGQPEHDPASGVYRITDRSAFFEGAVADEGRFDFDTARATGKNQPFTIVLYASLDGPSFGPLINKLHVREFAPNGALKDAPGWLVQLTWNEFGLRRLGLHQMLDNLHDRIIARTPEGVHATAAPGQMHLFVIHVPGDGLGSSVQMFRDGGAPLDNIPWPGGALSKRSVLNDAPLRIGGGMPFFAKGHPIFTGSIGFLEIWSGRGLLDGMSPQRYAQMRWNDGEPARGLITEAADGSAK